MLAKINQTWWFFIITVLSPVTAFLVNNWYENNVADIPYYNQGQQVTENGTQLSAVPDFNFLNQDSLPLNQDFVKGKIWIANYFFLSCPSICPKIVANMKLVQRAYRGSDDVRLISLTVDPKHDSVHLLKKYAGIKKINTRQWQLATADKKQLYHFARKGLFITASEGDGGLDDFIHSDRLVLIDQHNYIRGYYSGLETSDVNQLIKDISHLERMK